ncbi:MAG: SLC13 family permease [Paracoccus sp. (in: a-proteobacteria)]
MQLSGLMPHVQRRVIGTGDYLFRAGDPAETVFIIQEGTIRLEDGRGPGRRQAQGYAGQEALLGSPAHDTSALAETDTTVLAIPAAALAELAGQRRDLREAFFRSYAGRHEAGTPAAPPPPATEQTPPPAEGLGMVLGWILTIALPFAVYEISPQAHLDPAATDFVAIVLAAVVMWLFALVPEYVPPLFAALAMILLDVAPPEEVLSGFRSDSFFMTLSIFGIGALMVSSGLTYRFSLWTLGNVPATAFGYNLSLFGIGALLSPVIPSVVGRVSIVAPLMIELIEVSKPEARDRYANRLIFSLLSGAAIFVPLFLTAAVPNLMVYGLFDAQTQFAFGWLAWLYAASVFGGIVLVCFWLVSALFFRGARQFSLSRATIQEQRRLLGPVSALEWAALLAVIAMIGGILTGQSHRIDVAWIALAIFVILLLFGTLSRDAIRVQIDWPILIYLGAIVGWVPVAASTGLDQLIVGNLAWLGDSMTADFPRFILLVSGMILLVRLALPTGVTVILFTTALFPLAAAQGLSLWLIGFIILAVADTYVFPYQSSYYLKLRSDLAGRGLAHILDERRIVLANIVMIALRIAAIYGSLGFWQHLDLLS